MCPLFPASSAKAPATREGKARKGRREPDLLSFRIRLFETNFLGPQGCLNKKHTCGEPTAGVAHTFPGGIQGPGRGVTAHQRAPPEKATGPARLAHPGFGLEHPGNGLGALPGVRVSEPTRTPPVPHLYPTRTPLAEICGRSYPTRTPTVPHLYPNRTPIGFLNRAR